MEVFRCVVSLMVVFCQCDAEDVSKRLKTFEIITQTTLDEENSFLQISMTSYRLLFPLSRGSICCATVPAVRQDKTVG